MRKGLTFVLQYAFLLWLTAFASTSGTRAQSATADLYKAKCASCHAADGSGDTPAGKKLGAHDFRSAEVQKQTDAQLTEVIKKGKNKMPAYEKTLKEAQVKELVAYIRTLAKTK